MRALLVSVAALLVVGGCYNFSTPQYHPGDTRDVTDALSSHGVAVVSSVSGESACDDDGLVDNVVHLGVSNAADPTVRDLYIYTFKSSRWEESKTAVDACVAAYGSASLPLVTTRFDIPTYRAFGAGWSPDLASAIQAALTQASTEGE